MEYVSTFHNTHAFTATASGGFKQHRIADFCRLLLQKFCVLVVAMVARQKRYASGLHNFFGCRFRTHGFNRPYGWPNKIQAIVTTRFGKPSIFAEETIARVNGICTSCQSRLNDFVEIQVRGVSHGFANVYGLVGHAHV